MDSLNFKITTEALLDTFVEAGNLAKKISLQGVKITIKADRSPVTDGDIAVAEISLSKKTSASTVGVPLLSKT